MFILANFLVAVAKILNEGISKKGRRIVTAGPSNEPEARAVADTRLNAVILFGDKSEREAMKELVEAVESGGSQRRPVGSETQAYRGSQCQRRPPDHYR